MKSYPNQKHRAGRAFNSIDSETGYAVRFEKNRQGWCCCGILGCRMGAVTTRTASYRLSTICGH